MNTERNQPDLSTRRKTGAVILTASAAALFWAGWGLNLLPHTALNAVIGVAPIAALILILFARTGDVFSSVSSGLLALFPLGALAAALWFSPSTSAATQFAPNLFWPIILSAAAAMLALSTLGQSQISPFFAQAAVLLALALTLASVFGIIGSAARWILSTPIHTALWIAGLTAICAILAAAANARAAAPLRPFIAGITHLLPLLGFAGTIWGIMGALAALPEVFASEGVPDTAALQNMLAGLGAAFETTLLGVGAAILSSFLILILLGHSEE